MTERIRCFADIPDLLSMEVPPVEYVVPALGISRNSITLWTGADGDGKTYLAQAMTAAIAAGGEFLGMSCHKSPVLYLDLENPAHVVKDRFQAIIEEERTRPDFRIWGIWNETQPPQFGNAVLLAIAKETKPVIVIDPFRYFHTAEENDSTAMSAVMQYLRACAAHAQRIARAPDCRSRLHPVQRAAVGPQFAVVRRTLGRSARSSYAIQKSGSVRPLRVPPMSRCCAVPFLLSFL